MQTAADPLLPWLCAPPDSFRTDLRAGAVSLSASAQYALDLDQLLMLDRALLKSTGTGMGADMGKGQNPPDLIPLRLAVLSDGLADYVAPAIRATGVRHGFHLDLHVPPFGQATAELMTPQGPLAAFQPEAALRSWTAASLGLTQPHMTPQTAQDAVQAALAQAGRDCERLQAMGVGIVILETLPLPADPWAGHLDRQFAGSVRAQIAAFNTGLAQLASRHAALVLDTDLLAATVGYGRWQDAALWHRTKMPMAFAVVPLYADHVARLIRAARGRAAKCLVLDLDNTLWGGVIGDDGLEGIKIGQGSAEGEAYLAIHRFALALKTRGIILAVCSKNEMAAARLPFEKHPDMALRLDDIAVFVANWTDKATNIAGIAKTLNIGVDALVFLDDNPAERARVRQSLPMVQVPEVGDDPALYPTVLAQAGYFEALALTADDAARAEQYRANAQRNAEIEEIGDYDTYLASLDMTCDIRPFDATGRARIAQLINKSNQYNLTTRRYTEAEIGNLEADPAIFGAQIRLVDRFGDNGMISVVIFRKGPAEWVCDTWLMSCRVLKRRVEEAVLNVVAQAALADGVTVLRGSYVPSAKNAMVADHFARLGFTQQDTPANNPVPGQTLWRLDLTGWQTRDLPVTVETSF